MKMIYRFKIFALILGSALSICLGWVTSARAQERSYLIDLNSKTVTEIGTLGGDYSRATDINDSGQVVGLSRTLAGTYHAFITGPNGEGMRNLGTLGGRNSEASGINNAGQVVGSSDTPRGAFHAFITGVDGMNMRDLGTLSKVRSQASDINDQGQVVGWFMEEIAPGDRPDRGWHAFITGPNGAGMKDISDADAVPAWGFVIPSGINAVGQVVGTANDPPNRPFITGENGVGIRDVGLSGPGAVSSGAAGINDAGQVIISYWVPKEGMPEIQRSFITGPNGAGMTDLGNLGGDYTVARAINDAGQVVGQSGTAAAAYHAFITGDNGVGMTDLNSLVKVADGVILTRAVDINNAGQVIAIGVVPEPESYAMFLAGLGLLGFVAGRKRSK